MAFRLNRSLFEELRAAPPPRPSWTAARTFVVAVSIVLLLATLGGIGGGAYLIFGQHQFGLRVVGIVLVVVGLEVRPRWPRGKIEVGVLDRTEAPQLFALLDQISERLQAPRVTTLAVDEDWNAYTTKLGWRGEPAIAIGLPLWSALTPAGRLALLGHEVGHLINHDIARGVLTRPVFETFRRLARLFDPHSMARTRFANLAFLAWLSGAVGAVLFTPLFWLTKWTQIALWGVAERDHQRAEIYADAVGLRLAGTAGSIDLFDTLLFSERMHTAVARSARRGEPVEQWHLSAAQARTDAVGRERTAEQRTLRTQASLFASHPPDGLRRRLVMTWPDVPPGDLVESTPWAAIDESLAARYKRVRHQLTIQQ